MPDTHIAVPVVEKHIFSSVVLGRDVTFDCYLPPGKLEGASLLLINDGQDLRTMDFSQILEKTRASVILEPLFCIGIHCAPDRKNEYGTGRYLDYKGRGAKAGLYHRFILDELLPFIRLTYHIHSFKEKAFAGFSLGGLSALDIVWQHASEFTKVGVFSGSLWWRDKDQDDLDFDEDKNRIMHRLIREGEYAPWLKFFFEVGTKDEVADRNKNGIIDSIDDTQSLIEELNSIGYVKNDIHYLELQDGGHDISTWAKALPDFLRWGWAR